MKNLLRYAVQLKKQNLINKLIESGIYKKNNKHLYELTLSDLEKEYKDIKKIRLETEIKTGRTNQVDNKRSNKKPIKEILPIPTRNTAEKKGIYGI